jgi:hypothetical protein
VGQVNQREISLADSLEGLHKRHTASLAGFEDDLLARCVARLRAAEWRSPVADPPVIDKPVPGFCLQVLGVIEDDALEDGEAFVDIVAFWPETRRWTVTHASRADRDAKDHEVHVIAWKPIDELPPPWSALWA